MSVLLILGRFYRKRTKKQQNLGNFEGPRRSEGFLRSGVAERRKWPISGSPQRRASPWRNTVHSIENCCVLFSFAIPSFRGLVYWINEDLISVYKGPFMLKK